MKHNWNLFLIFVFTQSEFQDSLTSGCEYIDEIELPCASSSSNDDQTADHGRLPSSFDPENDFQNQRNITNVSSDILNNLNTRESENNSRKRKFKSSMRNVIL